MFKGRWLIVYWMLANWTFLQMTRLPFYLFIYLFIALCFLHKSFYSPNEIPSSSQEPKCPTLVCDTQLYLIFSTKTQY